MGDVFSLLKGTLANIFKIGTINVKDNSGQAQMRNSDDSGYSRLAIADGTEDEDAVTKSQLESATGTTIGASIAYCKMGITDTTQIKLEAEKDGAKYKVWVKDELVSVWPGAKTCNISYTLLAADGTDSEATPENRTTYFAYLSNSSASYVPLNLRLCQYPPADASGYLASTGNGENWLMVGKARVDGSGNFAWVEDTDDKPQYPSHIVLMHANSTILHGNSISKSPTAELHRYSQYAYQEPGADADQFYQCFCCNAGYYDIAIYGNPSYNRGKINWSIDGVAVETGQDWYTESSTYNVEKIISSVLIQKGKHTLKGTVSGKNGSSSGYYMILTAFEISQSE